MAQLYAGFAQAAEALRQFDLWVSTHPKDARLASVLNGRCWMRARLNIDLPLALEDCTEAVDKDDGDATYRDSLLDLPAPWRRGEGEESLRRRDQVGGVPVLFAVRSGAGAAAAERHGQRRARSGGRPEAEARDRRGSAQGGVRIRGRRGAAEGLRILTDQPRSPVVAPSAPSPRQCREPKGRS